MKEDFYELRGLKENFKAFKIERVWQLQRFGEVSD